MNGGEIKNNTISTQDESVKSYGVGGGIAVMASMDSLDITAVWKSPAEPSREIKRRWAAAELRFVE